eukprot:m.227389 g.227389  ORF g.227389 m.227389 type:complete len:85 (+) comp13871_c0_seq3:606-860(+)
MDMRLFGACRKRYWCTSSLKMPLQQHEREGNKGQSATNTWNETKRSKTQQLSEKTLNQFNENTVWKVMGQSHPIEHEKRPRELP